MEGAGYVPSMVDDEFPPRPARGRVVSISQRVGLSHTRRDAKLRLDALAGYLQDVADEDAATAPEDPATVWLLRRLVLSFEHVPRFRDQLALHTWASGTGARWAERRADVTRDGVTVVKTAGVWVHVERASGRPTPLPPSFYATWGETSQGRTVRARLMHGPPSVDVTEPWPLRATDIDIIGHVNNAAYWAAVEEHIARRGVTSVVRAEIEFRAGIDPSDSVELAVADRDEGFILWFLVDGEVRASALVACGP
ncbi:MAG: hypothetical protein JWL83_439 [Actinomycetia bacterium]|nr:hypothetical protein [Actinomycetes bacterium]